jgi:hypothetical protein
MPQRTRYTISLLPSDLDIIEHLEKIKEHTTISLYIKNLIKSDLNGNFREKPDVNQIVEMVIERLMIDGKLQVNVSADNQEVSISEEQRDIISSLF